MSDWELHLWRWWNRRWGAGVGSGGESDMRWMSAHAKGLGPPVAWTG